MGSSIGKSASICSDAYTVSEKGYIERLAASQLFHCFRKAMTFGGGTMSCPGVFLYLISDRILSVMEEMLLIEEYISVLHREGMTGNGLMGIELVLCEAEDVGSGEQSYRPALDLEIYIFFVFLVIVGIIEAKYLARLIHEQRLTLDEGE